jgi:RHS repeat-associated protein
MAFEADGDVKHRIQYGPTGDVLFDQVFNAAGTPTLQAEQDLQLLLGDHQHSVRVVVAHDANDAAYVQQSLNYTPFGQIGDLFYEDGGVPIDSPYIAASFGFQGMIYDDVVGQYRTQTRIYDSSLGRFISEDPIQDGSNWYAFAGNDPVNFADPSGLSQQGHPLGGAFSGNRTTAPTIKHGYIPANSFYGSGPALSPDLNDFIKGAVMQSLNPVRSTSPPLASSRPALIPNQSQSTFDPARPFRDATVNQLQQQRSDLESRRLINNAQKPATNLFGAAETARLSAINEELALRNPNWLKPTAPQQTGPSMSPISKEQYELGRLRHLSTKGVFANDAEEAEFANLQLDHMSGIDYFNAGVSVIGSFAGTPLQQRGSTALTSRVRTSSLALPTTTTPVGQLKTAGLKDAHHVIQNASVRDLPGYNKKAAPGIQLPGPSTTPGTPHYIATAIQRESGGGTYAAERRIGYKALRIIGYTQSEARAIIQEVDVYFNGIGVGPKTPTRIPGSRK